MLSTGLAIPAVAARSRGGGCPVPHVHGFTRPALSHWRSAKARVAAGTGRGTILCLGNSKTAGVTDVNGSAGDHQQSYPKYLADALAARGIAASYRNFVATAKLAASYNSQISAGAGWGASGNTIGGPAWYNNSTTNPLVWSPPGSIDTIDLYWMTASGYGTFTYAVDGGATTSVATAGASGIGHVTLSGLSAGAHTLTMARVSGTVRIIAAIGRLSTAPAIDVINAGWGGGISTEIAADDAAYRSLGGVRTLAPDLTILALDTNDYTPAYGPVSLTTYRANIAAIIAAGQVSGSVIVSAEYPSAITRQTLAIQQSYWAAAREVAVAAGCPWLDLPSWMGGSYEAAPSLYADDTHPTRAAYQAQAAWYADALAWA